MSFVASLEKWSLRSVTVAAGGRLPTQRAWPDCFGLRGGPLGYDGMYAGSEARRLNGIPSPCMFGIMPKGPWEAYLGSRGTCIGFIAYPYGSI